MRMGNLLNIGQNVLLGLDISTSIIGVTLLDEQTGEILLMKAIHLNTEKRERTFLEKVDLFKEHLDALLKEYNISKICIEDFLKGHSSTNFNSILLLAQYNGAIQLLLHLLYSTIPVKMINVRTARVSVVGKGIIKGKKQKEQVCDWFLSQNLWDFPKTDRKDKITKEFKLAKGYEDMIDSYVIAKAVWKITN